MVKVTLPQGLLGKAVSYSLNQWCRVSGYINHGIAKPDNNYKVGFIDRLLQDYV